MARAERPGMCQLNSKEDDIDYGYLPCRIARFLRIMVVVVVC